MFACLVCANPLLLPSSSVYQEGWQGPSMAFRAGGKLKLLTIDKCFGLSKGKAKAMGFKFSLDLCETQLEYELSVSSFKDAGKAP